MSNLLQSSTLERELRAILTPIAAGIRYMQDDYVTPIRMIQRSEAVSAMRADALLLAMMDGAAIPDPVPLIRVLIAHRAAIQLNTCVARQAASKGLDVWEYALEIACDSIVRTLLEKNADYGDSALSPVRVFSCGSMLDGLKVRIDDKLSRLKRGTAAGDDVVTDLLGYLLLLMVAERRYAERRCAAGETDEANTGVERARLHTPPGDDTHERTYGASSDGVGEAE